MNIRKVCTRITQYDIAIGLTALNWIIRLSKLISLEVGINVGKENGNRNGNTIVLIPGKPTIPVGFVKIKIHVGGGAGNIMHKISILYKILAKNHLNKKNRKGFVI